MANMRDKEWKQKRRELQKGGIEVKYDSEVKRRQRRREWRDEVIAKER